MAEALLCKFLNKFKFAGRNMRLFRKIMGFMDNIPYPGDLKNMIKTSIAFSKPGDEFDYLIRLYQIVDKNRSDNLKKLQSKGFTVREIEILTGISKSQVSRELKERKYE